MSSFKQGDIRWFEFPAENPQPQYTINGKHPALILHDDTHPNQTVIISPISSLIDKDGKEKDLKSYHLRLNKSDYPQLKNDSFVKLDQVMSFTRNKLTLPLICRISEKDKAALHLKLMESLQMYDTVKEITRKQIELTVEKVLNEYIEKLVLKEIE